MSNVFNVTYLNNPQTTEIKRDSSRRHINSAFYKLTDSKGQVYYGSSGHILKRLTKHQGYIRNGQHDYKNFIEDYENHKPIDVEVIYTENKEEALNMEQAALDANKNKPEFLNKATNARRAGLGKKLSTYAIQRIKETHTGKIVSEETRRKISLKSKGRPATESAKLKLRLHNLGKKHTEESIEKMRVLSTGKTHSVEARAKISAAKKGKGFPIEAMKRYLEVVSRPVKIDDVVYKSRAEASRALGLSDVTINNRIKNPKFTNYSEQPNFVTLSDIEETEDPMAKRLKYRYHRDGTIPLPGTNTIFVFGSNARGAHGASAALLARDLYGAETGVARGLMGKCYGIITKDRFIRTNSLDEIRREVAFFVAFTHSHPEMDFWVTRIGCGLAGYKNWQIAPMFRDANTNCNFPDPWKPYTR